MDGVTTFLAVAETCSFTVAARRLGVTTTAVSKAIRIVELRHGTALFERTTRRVALTEAGASLFERLRPAAAEIIDAFAILGREGVQPRGSLRVACSNGVARLLLSMLVPAFRRACPEVALEIVMDDAKLDLASQRHDACIRPGEAVEKDMVAVRLMPPIAWSVVGAPSYLRSTERPRVPEDLVGHQTIRCRSMASQERHGWNFRRGQREFVLDAGGGLVVNDRHLLVDLAVQGLGLAFVADPEVQAPVSAGLLEPMLKAYIPRGPGLYLYHSERSQSQLKLRLFVDLATKLAGEMTAASADQMPLPEALLATP